MPTPVLGITQVPESGTSKHIAVNDAIAKLESAGHSAVFYSSPPATLPTADFQRYALFVVDGLTAATSTALPASIYRLFAVANKSTTHVLTVGGIAVQPSSVVWLATTVSGNMQIGTSGGSGGFSPTVTSPTNGQILRYDGTNWINADHGFIAAPSSPTTGQLLKFDGAVWVPADPPWTLSTYLMSALPASDTVVSLLLPRAVSTPTGGGLLLAGVTGGASNLTLSFAKNGTEFGSAVLTPAGSVTSNTLTAQTFAAGDKLSISTDAAAPAWSKVSISMKGN